MDCGRVVANSFDLSTDYTHCNRAAAYPTLPPSVTVPQSNNFATNMSILASTVYKTTDYGQYFMRYSVTKKF